MRDPEPNPEPERPMPATLMFSHLDKTAPATAKGEGDEKRVYIRNKIHDCGGVMEAAGVVVTIVMDARGAALLAKHLLATLTSEERAAAGL